MHDDNNMTARAAQVTEHLIYIIRPLDFLQGLYDVERTFVRFGFALRQWWPDRKEKLCLTCERTFGHEKPGAFFCIEFNICKGAPERIILSGVCEECAIRSDNELRRAGVRGFFGKDFDHIDSPIAETAGDEAQHSRDTGHKSKHEDEDDPPSSAT
jgi:hypothetical protein